MLRKALTLGMVFILALSLLAVSMITCFTYDAEAHGGHICTHPVHGTHHLGEDRGVTGTAAICLVGCLVLSEACRPIYK